jgi:hypothetical protein
MTETFSRKNKVVCRTIEIRGDQTLEDLHGAIFDAFDREEEHMYEFRVGGRRPMDRKARCYVLPGAMDELFDENKPAGTVEATIGSLDLNVGEAFGYLFDFGDDWWHQVTLMAIDDRASPETYPRVTKRLGQSPPQYVDWDEDE